MLTPISALERRGVAGEERVQWNNWALSDLPAKTYPLYLLDMMRYLGSAGQSPNRLLGEPVAFSVDATRYEPKVTWAFEPQPDVGVQTKPEVETDKGVMQKEGNRLSFNLSNITRPGVVRVTRLLLGAGSDDERQETLAYAYNVDALAESNLKRAERDRLLPDLGQASGKRGKLTLLVPGSDYEPFKELKPDASEWPWLYLFIILILIVEQAMAVHLSHHTRTVEGAPEASPSTTPTAAAA